MKRKRISDTITNLSEAIIEEASTYQTTKTAGRIRKIKWMAAAACLLLALVISVPIFRKKASGPDKTLIDTVQMIEYENAYYEIIEDNPQALKKFGIITTKITSSLAGEHIFWLKPRSPESERSDFVSSAEKTDMELLTYQPSDNKAHLVFRNGEQYYIARFCNYLTPDDDASLPASAAFEIYGIFGADDIKSISPTSTDNTWEITGTAVTDQEAIVTFYQELITQKSYSWNEYHELVFGESLRDAEHTDTGDVGEKIYSAHADDLHTLVIETTDGIRFSIDYYPSCGWFAFSETDSYFQISPALSAWIKNNMG